MKFRTVTKLLALAVILSLSVVGCRKGLEKTTPLPGRGAANVNPQPPTGPIGGLIGDGGLPHVPEDTTKSQAIPAGLDKGSGVPLPADKQNWVASADQPFKGETVYFDYDKSTIKAGEVAKVERVASGIKGLAGKALRIEGHCDERGTEEYNRSLGERRALAVREQLMRAGVDPNLIDTISLGEDRPADPGHNEAAWSKNRRGEFIVIEPPTTAATSNGGK
jgi:peptidoglycan-associated lipoprotein